MYKALKQVETNRVGQVRCTFRKLLGGEHVHVFDSDKLTIAQLQAWLDGTFIQTAMPNLTADEREMFLSGDCSPFETKH